MRLFCPACGRTHGNNPEASGMVPKLCQCCAFLLDQSVASRSRHAPQYQTHRELRRYGLTYVLN